MTRSTRSLFLVATLALAPWARALAQDPPPETIRLSLRYNPGTKPGVLVLRVAGVNGDSIRAIIQRDFDYGDRISVIAAAETGLPDTPTGGRNGNYPLFARLGAVFKVEDELDVHLFGRVSAKRLEPLDAPFLAERIDLVVSPSCAQ